MPRPRLAPAVPRTAFRRTPDSAGVEGSPRLGSPLTGTRKFIAIGLNYADHAAESGLPIPAEPVEFMKATSCIQGLNDAVMLPRGSVKTDWEVELGVVIGTRARYVSEAEALSHVAGYCTINDISEREYQIGRGGTWDKGKGCDTFGPLGPGSSRATTLPTRKTWACGWTSTASACRPDRQKLWCSASPKSSAMSASS